MVDETDHRAYVGKGDEFDIRGALQFCVMTNLGLREDHHLLDVGCGSLRGGRLFIVYLNPGRYCGVELNATVLADGIEKEIGPGLAALKKAEFLSSDEFDFSYFQRDFDWILCQALFCHLGPQQIQDCLVAAERVLAAKGEIIASYHEGDPRRAGPGGEFEAVGTPVYPEVRYYLRGQLRKWGRKAGLAMEEINQPWFDYSELEEVWIRMQWVRFWKKGAGG